MRDSRTMLSVGVDVGTTTTQVVFSRLELYNVARPGQIPRIEVSARSVLFTSDISFTPLISPDEIDSDALVAIVEREYGKAGMTPEMVETGAVIITGEIARTKNADVMLEALSDFAGDFVVTVAGPNVEAQIAGRGSGAAAYSAEHYTQVTNIDIGGGTANAAIFKMGRNVSASAMAVGGRQVILEGTSGIVRRIAGPGRAIIDAFDIPLQEGRPAELSVLEDFCDRMADLTADLAQGIRPSLGDAVQLSPPLTASEESTTVFLSGGVARYFYEPLEISSIADVAVHNDVGPLFARSLRLNPRFRSMKVIPPGETLRATVLGAASQTITLSGSTIWTDGDILPLRNLAVIYPQLEQDDFDNPGRFSASTEAAVRRWDQHTREIGFALALDVPQEMNYRRLSSIAEGLGQFYDAVVPEGMPLVLVLQRDFAQSLGQTIKALRGDIPVISIDQVGLGEGDFIDIGEPILGGRVVPLSIKTLVFYQ
ncbi:Reactivating factor of Adenosylcobalamin-dependent ethanolamine ammonia lyase [Alkalispirochaeta americana]|uniref:Reactivating factor of Adenosylcobalamin-dependent ethanolamine ammonia lyase n=1 Tax=Alkalispirochaeta americana TaxID=159291 RepID=A0A1N6U008_9SPIO|nr:ethanolamine ammonia-lyase reactivating factor EutA [Alkalispirochaeta americana]SIQ58877.1 Reactivating factor of Adenosylcobalamin-dependent ethanolamine ammonia lyase [Alkalispirochaeta americana]